MSRLKVFDLGSEFRVPFEIFEDLDVWEVDCWVYSTIQSPDL